MENKTKFILSSIEDSLYNIFKTNKEISTNSKRSKSDSKGQNSHSQDQSSNFKQKSKLHLHLLNEKDIKLILDFVKAFFKAGRSFTEEIFEHDPRRLFFKVSAILEENLKEKFGYLYERYKNKFSKLLKDRYEPDTEKLVDKQKYDNHIKALRELYTPLNTSPKILSSSLPKIKVLDFLLNLSIILFEIAIEDLFTKSA